jgi:hypothetical protein
MTGISLRLGRGFAAVAVLSAAVGVVGNAHKAYCDVVPTMAVHVSLPSFGYYDDSGNYEMLITYIVTNTSPGTGIGYNENDMTTFTLSAGANQGVVLDDETSDASHLPPGWSIITPTDSGYSPNFTQFINGTIKVGYNSGEFDLISTFTNAPSLGYATAMSDENGAFNDVSVDVPSNIPEPATLSLLALGGAVLFRRKRN